MSTAEGEQQKTRPSAMRHLKILKIYFQSAYRPRWKRSVIVIYAYLEFK